MAVSGGQGGPGGIAISSSAPCAFALCAPCGCTAAALQSRYARPTRALIVFSGTPLYRRCSAIGMKAAGRGVLTRRSAARGIVCFIAFFCDMRSGGVGKRAARGRRHASSPASAAFKRPPPVMRNRSLSRTTPRPVGNHPVTAARAAAPCIRLLLHRHARRPNRSLVRRKRAGFICARHAAGTPASAELMTLCRAMGVPSPACGASFA